MSLEDIVKAVATEQITDIDIWSKLKHYFTEYWDGQPDIFLQVKNLSNRQLGGKTRNIHNTALYFDALENNFSDKNDLLEFLINLTGHLKIHTELGAVNVEETLKQCRHNLRKVRQICIKRGIFKDQHFIGREKEIKEIEDVIQSGDKKGILLCGLGGMGKTCLANAVCYELRGDNWSSTKIELREQRTFRHFLRTTIHSIAELRGSTSGSVKTIENGENVENVDAVFMEEPALRDILTNYIKDKKIRKQIFLFDNLEDSTTDPEEKLKVLGYFKSLLEVMKNIDDCKIRIIITSREDFLINSTEESTKQHREELKQLLYKKEVKKLDLSDARELVKNCTKMHVQSRIDDVVRICGACPLALRVVSDLINNSIHAAEVISVLGETVVALPTSVLNMQQCLSKPYENLMEYKPVLCQLSVFGTTKFNLRSATRVVHGKDGISCMNLRNTQLNLLFFKSRHFLEVQNDYEDDFDQWESGSEFDEHLADKEIYSLHPVVLMFLTERGKDTEVANAVQTAKFNFLSLLDEIVVGIGEEYDSNVLNAREKSERQKVHILKYLQIMEDYNTFSEIPFWQNLQSAEEFKRRSNVVKLIHNPDQHLSFLSSMTTKSEEKTLERCSWEVEHITSMIIYEKFSINITKQCQDLIDILDKFPTDLLNDKETQQLLILRGRMWYNRGLLEMRGNLKLSEGYFQKAEQLFNSCLIDRKSVTLYMADIYNCLGLIFYRTGEAGKAIEMHEEALNTLGKNNAKNENVVTFYANIAVCYFRLGKEHFKNGNNVECDKKMEEALKYYRESINIAQALKMEKTDIYVKKLKSRGDVYTMLQKYTEAEKDYNECLEIIRTLYPPHSQKEIICLHAKGDLLRRQIVGYDPTQGVPQSTDGMVNNNCDMVIEGNRIYSEVIKMMNPNVLPGDHYYFGKIKRNHLYFLKEAHEMQMYEDTLRFYSAYDMRSLNEDIESTDSSGSSTENSSNSDEDVEEPNPHLNNQSTVQMVFSDTLSEESSTESDSSQLITADYKTCNTKSSGNFSDTTQQKQNFKLPLQAPMKLKPAVNTLSCSFWSNKTERSSSSGISSTGGLTPDIERRNIRETRPSLDSGQGSSFEDDVFPNKQLTPEDRKDLLKNPQFQKSRSMITSFSSESMEDMDIHHRCGKSKRKLDKSTPQDESPLKKLRSEEFLMKDKSSQPDVSALAQESASTCVKLLTKHNSGDLLINDEKTDRSSQTDDWTIESTVDVLEVVIPTATPRLETLVRTLKSGNAQLVDDEKGRPIVEYTDDVLSNKSINDEK